MDGVDCGSVTVTNSSHATCVVGPRPSTYTKDNTFEVMVGVSKAIIRDHFLYILKWSDPRSWGVSMPPIDKDLIYIPKGTTLYVDQSTPVLEGIVVEGGTIVFADGKDLIIETGFITLSGGKFIAGT